MNLAAISESPDFWKPIEHEIIETFRKLLYLPLIREFGRKTVRNAADSLISALLNGTLTYNRGVFSGQFNARTSRDLRDLGARWDRSGRCYRLTKNLLPPEVQFAISTSRTSFEKKIEKIDARLAQVVPEELAEQMKTERLFDRSIWEMDRRIKKSFKRAKFLAVQAQLTPEQRKRIAAEWQNNMKLWIQDFTAKEIKELRTRLQESVLKGNRYESVISTIEKSYGVTKRKAEFLASQETRLLLCKFKETRYADAGVRQYKWKCVSGTAAHPVRPRHRELNDLSQNKGMLFRFDQPPVSTGAGEPARRNNPGEDFNCRCVAIPVVDFRPIKT